jgi:RNA polymerase sigma factor (sigma-70 family)
MLSHLKSPHAAAMMRILAVMSLRHWSRALRCGGLVLIRQETPETFAQLLARARRHDEQAIAALYQRALPTVYRYVLARSRRPDLTEDIVAECFLAMVESIGSLRANHEAGFFAWMLRIAQAKVARALHQSVQNQNRQQYLSGSGQDDEWLSSELVATDLASDPVALHEWREAVQELGIALGSLSEEQQIVIIGRFLAGQSVEELAQGMGKQPGAIRALQFRALDTLAERMGKVREKRRSDKGGGR